MPKFVTVMKKEDLPSGKSVIISAGEEEIALFNYKGNLHAIANKCLHKGSSLGEGRIEEGIVICPNHEWRYDLKTGDCPQNPNIRMKIYKVQEEDGEIQIELETKEDKKRLPVGKAASKLPGNLKFNIPVIQKPVNPDEEL